MEKVAPILLQGTSNKFSDYFLNGRSILQCHRAVGETMALSKTTDTTLTSLILACEMWSTNPPWLLLFRAGLVTAAFLVVPVEVDFFLLKPVPVDISLTAQVLEKNVGLCTVALMSYLVNMSSDVMWHASQSGHAIYRGSRGIGLEKNLRCSLVFEQNLQV